MRKILFVMVTLVIIGSQAAVCEEFKVDIQGELSYVTRYIWRGYDALPNDNDALQPGFTFEIGESGHSLNIWGSTAVDNSGDMDEVDLTWNYSKPLMGRDNMDLSMGMIYYGYANRSDDSAEVYVGVSLPKMALSPTLMVFADYGSGKGYYATLGVGHTVSSSIAGRPINLGASVGYQDGYWGFEPGISDITLSLSTLYSVGTIDLIPALNYALIPEESVNPIDEGEFWFSLTGVTEIKHTN